MTITPTMQQFYDIKKDYSDSILFFRMGDFYEMFDEDAEIAHKVLGISITSRNKNAEKPTPLAGIPYHAKDKYLPQLVNAGYKVAIAEQVSDPKLKGIVKREVIRVVTPSTLLLEGENYENNSSNYIVSIINLDCKYGASYLDLNTNKWIAAEFHSLSEIQSWIYKISPKEVILEKNMYNLSEIDDLNKTLSKKFSLNVYYFSSQQEAENKLIKHFGVKNLEGFGLKGKNLAIKASGQLIEYLEANQKSKLNFLNSISYISFEDYMNLDESTIKSLDLIYNFATKSPTVGTLFGVINKTKTTGGANILREQIVRPLKKIDDINSRLNFIEELLKNNILLDKIRKKLESISNIDAILNRLALNRSNPRDLINLKNSLISILEIIELINNEGNEKLIKIINS